MGQIIIIEDTGICLGCKEHSDNICETCEGIGLIKTGNYESKS
jgi:hypothetical protein